MKIGAKISLMILLPEVDPMKILAIIEKILDQSLDMDSITIVKGKDIGQMNAYYSKRKRRKSVLLILVM